MELLPTIDALHWIADHGPEILGDERVEQPADLPQAEEGLVRVSSRSAWWA